MTREEAIKKMQAVKAYMTSDNPIWGVTEMGEAFDMAIKALEEQPIRCKNCKHFPKDKMIHCNRVAWWNREEDYCSFAERKEGEADADD